MHHVAQPLPIHAGLPRGILPRCALQDHGDRQQPASLSRVTAFRRDGTKLPWRAISAGDFDGVGTDQIMRLATGQVEADRIAERIDQGMDLGAQPAARAPDRLVLAIFFLAPALC